DPAASRLDLEHGQIARADLGLRYAVDGLRRAAQAQRLGLALAALGGFGEFVVRIHVIGGGVVGVVAGGGVVIVLRLRLFGGDLFDVLHLLGPRPCGHADSRADRRPWRAPPARRRGRPSRLSGISPPRRAAPSSRRTAPSRRLRRIRARRSRAWREVRAPARCSIQCRRTCQPFFPRKRALARTSSGMSVSARMPEGAAVRRPSTMCANGSLYEPRSARAAAS